VEALYIKALEQFDKALANKDSLSSELSSKASFQKSTVQDNLYKIYKDFIETATALKEAGVAQTAEDFEKRATVIKPYIESFIETNTTDENE
jgi:hypothetical protein